MEEGFSRRRDDLIDRPSNRQSSGCLHDVSYVSATPVRLAEDALSRLDSIASIRFLVAILSSGECFQLLELSRLVYSTLAGRNLKDGVGRLSLSNSRSRLNSSHSSVDGDEL